MITFVPNAVIAMFSMWTCVMFSTESEEEREQLLSDLQREKEARTTAENDMELTSEEMRGHTVPLTACLYM